MAAPSVNGSPESWVTATGTGVTITFSGSSGEVATLNVPAGVTVLSAVIGFPASAIPQSSSTVQFNFGSNGTGDNSAYAKTFIPTCQVWPFSGSYALKTTCAFNMSAGPSIVTASGLNAGVPIWLKVTF
jgi:hypothetical protein